MENGARIDLNVGDPPSVGSVKEENLRSLCEKGNAAVQNIV